MGKGDPQTKDKDTLATVRGGSGLEGGVAISPLCLLNLSLCLLSCATPVRWETERANTLDCGLRFKHLDLCFSSPQAFPLWKIKCNLWREAFIFLVYKISSFHILLQRLLSVSEAKNLCNPGCCPWFFK